MTPRREDAAGAEPHDPYANWQFPSEKSEPREGSAEWYADKLDAANAALLAARREVEALRTALARVIASDGPGCVCKACTTARAALAATPEEKNA